MDLHSTAQMIREHLTEDQDGNQYYKGHLLDPHWENNQDILGVYCFFDEKSKRYDTPFFCQSDMFAKRHYHMVLKQDGMVKEFQSDFSVHRIGTFNLRTAEFESLPEQLVVPTNKGVE